MNQLIKIENSVADDINTALLYVIKLIGVPAEKLKLEDNLIIIDYLQRNLPKYNVQDIRNAFEAGIRGDLDFDMNHYHSFNSMYVVNVLQSYNRHLASTRRNKPIETKAPPALTYDESRHHSNEVEKKYLDNTLEKGFANWTVIYFHLKKEDKINFTSDQIKDFQLKCRLDINDEVRNLSKAGKTSISLIMALEMDDLFYCECRKRAVIQYFETKR